MLCRGETRRKESDKSLDPKLVVGNLNMGKFRRILFVNSDSVVGVCWFSIASKDTRAYGTRKKKNDGKTGKRMVDVHMKDTG